MFRDGNNLKDMDKYTDIVIKDSPAPLSYTKTDKLITALYMVTDIIDPNEPLRNKLRTLGTNILSDTYAMPSHARPRIKELLSFLKLASDMNIISPMNCTILEKEFRTLDQAIQESVGEIPQEPVNLSDYLREELEAPKELPLARLGVQRGDTLMRALSKVERSSIKDMAKRKDTSASPQAEGVDPGTKKQRREDILHIIKSMNGGATIKDIKDKSATLPSLNSCSEKTIQRELVSLVKDKVLARSGDKRWSKYYISGL